MEKLQEVYRKNPESREYLQQKVFPVVADAFEALLKEIEFRQKRVEEGEPLPEIKPLLFLAQYLMRNNPTQVVRE